jgi:hypothetical protein
MLRLIRTLLVAAVVALGLAGPVPAGEAPPFASSPPAAAHQFCYAFGSAEDGSATIYYTGVFQAAPQEAVEVQQGLRRFLAGKYGSQRDTRAGEQDVTCVQPSPASAAAAQQQMDVYVANMRRGGGTVVETGWQHVATPAAAAPGPAQPVTLPDDPRIASASPQMRVLLEGRKRDAGAVCLLENGGQDPVYDCDCYVDRIVIATLDQGATITQSVDGAGRPASMLSPQIELVVPRADLHACVKVALLPKRAYDRGMQVAGMYSGDAKQRLAQCIADDAMVAYRANPGKNMQYFDNLVRNACRGCAAKVQ